MSIVPLHDVCQGMEQELQIYSCGLLSTLSGAICKDHLGDLSQPLCSSYCDAHFRNEKAKALSARHSGLPRAIHTTSRAGLLMPSLLLSPVL